MNQSPTTPSIRDLFAVVILADPVRARRIQDRMVADLAASGEQTDELRARRDVRLAMLRWNLWAVHGWPAATILFSLIARFAIEDPLMLAWCKTLAIFSVVFYIIVFIIPKKYGMRAEILRSKGVSLE